MASKEPDFSIVNKVGDIEIRNYSPMMIAEVLVGGTMEAASGSGFRMIADFIFGNNTAKTGKPEKIDMTVPVVISRSNTGWFFYFVMPAQYSLESLPKPNNREVKIKQLKDRRCAVLKFSGKANEDKFNEKSAVLIDWIKSEKLIMLGNPELARYNPPWTLPFLRRNEIMIEIE
jgi:effector-binding domain-containing protein